MHQNFREQRNEKKFGLSKKDVSIVPTGDQYEVAVAHLQRTLFACQYLFRSVSHKVDDCSLLKISF